jgi:hypothetical protein
LPFLTLKSEELRKLLISIGKCRVMLRVKVNESPFLDLHSFTQQMIIELLYATNYKTLRHNWMQQGS